jgi:hypothetical protein
MGDQRGLVHVRCADHHARPGQIAPGEEDHGQPLQEIQSFGLAAIPRE